MNIGLFFTHNLSENIWNQQPARKVSNFFCLNLWLFQTHSINTFFDLWKLIFVFIQKSLKIFLQFGSPSNRPPEKNLKNQLLNALKMDDKKTYGKPRMMIISFHNCYNCYSVFLLSFLLLEQQKTWWLKKENQGMMVTCVHFALTNNNRYKWQNRLFIHLYCCCCAKLMFMMIGSFYFFRSRFFFLHLHHHHHHLSLRLRNSIQPNINNKQQLWQSKKK